MVEKFATGVADTGGKFATGVVDTDGNFAAGVVDTGDFKRSKWNTLGLGGELIHEKPEAKNLVTLSL